MVDEYYDSAYADYPLKALTKNTELTTEVQQKVMYEIDSLLEAYFESTLDDIKAAWKKDRGIGTGDPEEADILAATVDEDEIDVDEEDDDDDGPTREFIFAWVYKNMPRVIRDYLNDEFCKSKPGKRRTARFYIKKDFIYLSQTGVNEEACYWPMNLDQFAEELSDYPMTEGAMYCWAARDPAAGRGGDKSPRRHLQA